MCSSTAGLSDLILKSATLIELRSCIRTSVHANPVDSGVLHRYVTSYLFSSSTERLRELAKVV